MEPHDIADQVLAGNRTANKAEWGEEMWRLIAAHNDEELNGWLRARIVASLGSFVGQVKAAREQRKQKERQREYGVSSGSGRPVNPYLSVRGDDGSRQGLLWIEATPIQFMEAVFREEAVVRGRAEANAVRMKLAELIQEDEQLQELADLKTVCSELNIDPDTLGLAELPGTDAA